MRGLHDASGRSLAADRRSLRGAAGGGRCSVTSRSARRMSNAPRGSTMPCSRTRWHRSRENLQVGDRLRGVGLVGVEPPFWVLRPYDRQPQSAGNGPMVAFMATTRSEVEAFHKAALSGGGRDEGAPGLRPHFHPDFTALRSRSGRQQTVRRLPSSRTTASDGLGRRRGERPAGQVVFAGGIVFRLSASTR